MYCMQMYTCACVGVCANVCIYVCMYKCMCIYVHACMHACVHERLHMLTDRTFLQCITRPVAPRIETMLFLYLYMHECMHAGCVHIRMYMKIDIIYTYADMNRTSIEKF